MLTPSLLAQQREKLVYPVWPAWLPGNQKAIALTLNKLQVMVMVIYGRTSLFSNEIFSIFLIIRRCSYVSTKYFYIIVAHIA